MVWLSCWISSLVLRTNIPTSLHSIQTLLDLLDQLTTTIATHFSHQTLTGMSPTTLCTCPITRPLDYTVLRKWICCPAPLILPSPWCKGTSLIWGKHWWITLKLRMDYPSRPWLTILKFSSLSPLVSLLSFLQHFYLNLLSMSYRREISMFPISIVVLHSLATKLDTPIINLLIWA